MTIHEPDSGKDVPSPIDFHDRVQAEEWVRNTVAKRPYRGEYFAAFAEEINAYSPSPATILEIGSGPGHLARALLEQCNIAHYTLLDFSAPMHEIAKEHLGLLKDKAIFIERDFKASHWMDGLKPVDIIVTMQAAHEVRHKRHVPVLLNQLYTMLREGGLLLYADHYYTEGKSGKHPDLYFTHPEQLTMLRTSHFRDVTQVLDKGEMALYRARR